MKTKIIILIVVIYCLNSCSNEYKIDPTCVLLTSKDSLSQEVQKVIKFMDQYADKNNIGGSYLFVDNKNYLQQMIDISVYSTFIEFSWWDNEPGKNIRKYSWHFSLNEDAYKGYYFEKDIEKNYIKENVNIQKLQELNKILKKRNK